MINAVDAVSSAATAGLDINADVAGTTHFGGPANVDASGNYYVMDLGLFLGDRRANNRRVSTLREYEIELAVRLLPEVDEKIPRLGPRNIRSIKRRDVKAHLNALRNHGCTVSQVNKAIKAAKAIFSYAFDSEYVRTNIMHRYPKLHRVEGERVANRGVFTVSRMIGHAHSTIVDSIYAHTVDSGVACVSESVASRGGLTAPSDPEPLPATLPNGPPKLRVIEGGRATRDDGQRDVRRTIDDARRESAKEGASD